MAYESTTYEMHLSGDVVGDFEKENPERAKELMERAKKIGGNNSLQVEDAYELLVKGEVARTKGTITSHTESPINSLSKSLSQKMASGAAEAEKAAAAPVPAEAASLQPTVAQSAQVFDMSGYTTRAKALVEDEADSNNQVRGELEGMRRQISLRAQNYANLKNQWYIQTQKAAVGDNVTLNSTVPVVVEQSPDTVQVDAALEATEPGDFGRTYMLVDQSDLDASESEQAFASLEQGDAAEVEQIIHDHDANAQAEAQYLAQLDASKQVATELAKEAGKTSGQNLVNDVMSGKLTANKLLQHVDYFIGNLGDSIGSYVGAALSGIPSPNNCASQTLSNIGLGVSGVLITINVAATVANGLATFGANLADSIADTYVHGPELLISMAETTAQTAAQTTMMALRNASKTNCTAAFAYGTIKGAVAVGETTIRAGISVATKAKELQGAAENLVKVVEKKDFVGDLKKKVKLHPAVREMDRFIKSNKTDIATYSRLTRNGDKFARVMLGVDAQNRYSSVKKHCTNIVSSMSGFRRLNYSTTAECNRWNLYNKQTFSLADAL